jgi:CDP-glucose 4,6-dehydratase
VNLLECVRASDDVAALVFATSDKCYRNVEVARGYVETDRLGGHDPYSASKAAAELVFASYLDSFFRARPGMGAATSRAGNVIGGGDWAVDRIVPDAMRALAAGEPIGVRNPSATRPWQHVLEPLGGYLMLAERLSAGAPTLETAFNFGPALEANRSVRALVEEALRHWPGRWEDRSDPASPHEAGLLHLVVEKAHHELGWEPRWPFATTVERTVNWYRRVEQKESVLECCRDDLAAYLAASLAASDPEPTA